MLKPPRFNAYYEIEDVKPVDAAKLEARALRPDRRQAALDGATDLELPEQELIIRHICVEGWDYIGQWSGPNLQAVPRTRRRRPHRQIRHVPLRRRLLRQHRHGDRAASADHPRDQICASEPITDPFGFPLRLRTSTKLGFKNPKWITSIEVTNTYPGGYWEDRGFNWHSGL